MLQKGVFGMIKLCSFYTGQLTIIVPFDQAL